MRACSLVIVSLALLAAIASAPAASALPPLDRKVDLTTAVVFPVEELPREGENLVFPEANVDGSVVVAGAEITLAADVFFDYNEYALTPRAVEELAAVAERLRAGSASLTVVGHTDAKGSDADNLVLSRRRAEAVREHLQLLLPGRSIEASGRGETEPVAENDTDEGRAANRRVVITTKG